jgi:hypothetical protein
MGLRPEGGFPYMTIREVLLLVVSVAIVGTLVWKRMAERAIIAAGPENESRFMQTYDPMVVARSFRSPCASGDRFAQVGRTRSETAGSSLIGHQKAVEHHLLVTPRFCGDADRTFDLMAALHSSLRGALRGSGCLISADRVMTKPEVYIAYRCGTATTGVVNAELSSPLPGDGVHIALSFHVDERWL